MRVLIVVLGDLGRSPRMLAHTAALLSTGHDVHLVGGTGTPLPPALQGAPRLHVHALALGESGGGAGLASSLATGLRGLRLAWVLVRVLFRDTPSPDVVLVQNPPALPTLPVALAAARLRRARLMVDWHNLGWTLLALRFGPSHPLVRVMRWTERVVGQRADAHLAVSHRLANHLMTLGLRDVRVLHDGPSASRPFPPARRDLPDDPLVVVAPMGWTRDDDLPLLSEALQRLADQVKASPSPCRMLRLRVSGNGPMRAAWGPRLLAQNSDAIQVDLPDVATQEYPHLLASSHLGLCLHRSSSGFDLPMKLLELQAVGLPSLALDDGSPLDEIAPPECGVARFRTAEELAERLFAALRMTADGAESLPQLTSQARRYAPKSWDDAWNRLMTSDWFRPS